MMARARRVLTVGRPRNVDCRLAHVLPIPAKDVQRRNLVEEAVADRQKSEERVVAGFRVSRGRPSQNKIGDRELQNRNKENNAKQESPNQMSMLGWRRDCNMQVALHAVRRWRQEEVVSSELDRAAKSQHLLAELCRHRHPLHVGHGQEASFLVIDHPTSEEHHLMCSSLKM